MNRGIVFDRIMEGKPPVVKAIFNRGLYGLGDTNLLNSSGEALKLNEDSRIINYMIHLSSEFLLRV